PFTYWYGISWAHVADKPDFSTTWLELCSILNGVHFLAAHNANFDASVLRACCQRYGVAVPDLPFVCTVELARATWRIYPTKLPNVCTSLGLPLDHHNPA